MDDLVKKPASSLKTCPICGKPQAEATRPFCSSRCRDVDLNRWLKGSYVIPGSPDGPASPSNPLENDPEEINREALDRARGIPYEAGPALCGTPVPR